MHWCAAAAFSCGVQRAHAFTRWARGRGVKITFEEDHSAAVALGVAGLFLLVAFVIVFVHLSSKKGGRVVARKLQ